MGATNDNNNQVELPGIKSTKNSNTKQNGEVLNYMDYLRALKAAWSNQPIITIDYRNITYNIPLPVNQTRIPTIANKLGNIFQKTETKPFYALNNISGTITPGSLTLLLSPRGHGRSLFLRTLCGL